MKIVVLAGGVSTERNVSLASGTEICKALRSRGHQAILVDLFLGLDTAEGAFDAPDGFCSHVSIGRNAPSIDEVKKLRGGNPNCHIGPYVLDVCREADIVFLGLHGADGEDGKIQATLDLLGVPYTGSGCLGSAMAMDKAVSKQIMQLNGIRTPAWFEITVTEDTVESVAAQIELPCVVKTPAGGSSIGVLLPDTREELKNALREAIRFSPRVIIEQRITGRELTVPVLNETYLPAIEIIPPEGTYFDYIAKYQSGSDGALEVCPAPITEEQFHEMGSMALRLHNALALTVYSRADFILDQDGTPWCLETNTLPGMTSASLLPKSAAAAGLSYPELCETICKLSLAVKR